MFYVHFLFSCRYNFMLCCTCNLNFRIFNFFSTSSLKYFWRNVISRSNFFALPISWLVICYICFFFSCNFLICCTCNNSVYFYLRENVFLASNFLLLPLSSHLKFLLLLHVLFSLLLFLGFLHFKFEKFCN